MFVHERITLEPTRRNHFSVNLENPQKLNTIDQSVRDITGPGNISTSRFLISGRQMYIFHPDISHGYFYALKKDEIEGELECAGILMVSFNNKGVVVKREVSSYSHLSKPEVHQSSPDIQVPQDHFP